MNTKKEYECLINQLDKEWNIFSMTDAEALKYYEMVTGLEPNIPIEDLKEYLLEYVTESLVEDEIIDYEEAGKLIAYIEEKWKNKK